MVNKVVKAGRIPAVLVGWNIFDALLHVAIDMAEPLRITGNIIAICAFIELLEGANISEEELVRFARSKLAGFKTPKTIIFQELPKTSTGKIQKFELRKQASEGS